MKKQITWQTAKGNTVTVDVTVSGNGLACVTSVSGLGVVCYNPPRRSNSGLPVGAVATLGRLPISAEHCELIEQAIAEVKASDECQRFTANRAAMADLDRSEKAVYGSM